MTRDASGSTEPEEKERRRVWIIPLILVLSPVCLCLATQAALLGLAPDQVEANLISQLEAQYGQWKAERFNPVNPALIGTIRAEQLTQISLPGRMTAQPPIAFVTLEGQPTKVAAGRATPTAGTPPATSGGTARPTTGSPPPLTRAPTGTRPPVTGPPPTTAPPPTNTSAPTRTTAPTATSIPPTPVPPTNTSQPPVRPTVQFQVSNFTVTEDGITATITVTLSAASGATVRVDYATSDITATAGSDYTAAADTLFFSPGQTVATFDVTILDDSLSEADEDILLTLSNPVNATLGAPAQAILTILDDEPLAITGTLRNEVNYAGGNGSAAGVCDASLQGLTVRLEQGGVPVVPNTVTDANCQYSFAPPAPGIYTVVVDLGPLCAGVTCPEQTYEYGNGGAGALGGDDPNVANDHQVDVFYAGTGTVVVDFGFSYEAVVNAAATGQGSLEQAIINANQIPGANTIVFAPGSYIIAPPAGGFSPLTGPNTTIDGSTATAVTLNGGGIAADGLTVQANGVSLLSLAIQNFGGHGILINTGSNALIQSNTITGNGGDGIRILNAVSTGNLISLNSISANGGLGIDLGGDGVTPSTTLPPGPNNYYPFPTISPIGGSGRFRLDVAAGAIVEVFLSDGDPSGYGEGLTYLFTVIDDGLNDLSFSTPTRITFNVYDLDTCIPDGAVFTVTARDPLTGDTSEFSANITVPSGPLTCP
jgi:hypothetical protein